ncbi:MAG: hypothetical protein ACD_44C00049G0010 [uncultured bacterium]|nr:MAG: hypothetical protein ACD_44C00049G0010 [uncultured bacterium]
MIFRNLFIFGVYLSLFFTPLEKAFGEFDFNSLRYEGGHLQDAFNQTFTQTQEMQRKKLEIQQLALQNEMIRRQLAEAE